jgi:hypothetical protein
MNLSAVPPTYPPITIESEINRRLNYECVKNSKIRDAYLFGHGTVNPNHPKLLAHQRKIKLEVEESGLTMIIHENGRNFFAVKKTLRPEDMVFLKNVPLAFDKYTPEENSRLGNLLGYPCEYNRENSYVVDVVCTNIEPNIILFSFTCTDEPTDKMIHYLTSDIQNSLTDFHPTPIIEIRIVRKVVKKGGKRKTRRKRKRN